MLARILAVALLAVLALAGYQWGRAEHAGRRADAADARARGFEQALDQSTRARAEERRRHHALQEALDAEHLARQALEADVRRADAAAVGLRDRARQLAAARCPAGDSAAAEGGPPADAAGDLLAVMLERLDERAGELARYADQARLAGLTCQRAYETLTP